MKVMLNPVWGRWLLRRRLMVYLVFSLIVYVSMEATHALWANLPANTEDVLRNQQGFDASTIWPRLLSLLSLILIPVCLFLAFLLFGYLGRMVGLYVKPQAYFLDLQDQFFRIYHPGSWIVRKIDYANLEEISYQETPTSLRLGLIYRNPKYSEKWARWIPRSENISDLVYISNDVYSDLKSYLERKAPGVKTTIHQKEQ